MLLQSPREQYSQDLKATVHFVSSIPLRSAVIHRTELNFRVTSQPTVRKSPVFTNTETKMANRPKSSAQRSRSPSPSAEEVIESQEELLNSEHEEDL